MFNFLKRELNKKIKKIGSKGIDIIFVAHRVNEVPMFLASCLLPLPTIKNVMLPTVLLQDKYSPKHKGFFQKNPKHQCKRSHASRQCWNIYRVKWIETVSIWQYHITWFCSGTVSTSLHHCSNMTTFTNFAAFKTHLWRLYSCTHFFCTIFKYVCFFDLFYL